MDSGRIAAGFSTVVEAQECSFDQPTRIPPTASTDAPAQNTAIARLYAVAPDQPSQSALNSRKLMSHRKGQATTIQTPSFRTLFPGGGMAKPKQPAKPSLSAIENLHQNEA